MTRSPLLQIVRDSIEEVIEARRIIKRDELLEKYPVLEQSIASVITLNVSDELREARSDEAIKPLIDDIIYNAKAAAFQDAKHSPITTAQYLRCTISLSLLIPDDEGGFIMETSTDGPLLKD